MAHGLDYLQVTLKPSFYIPIYSISIERKKMGDLTSILMGASLVVLAWTVAKINEKVDKHIRKFKKLEEALKKNAPTNIPENTNFRGFPTDIYS